MEKDIAKQEQLPAKLLETRLAQLGALSAAQAIQPEQPQPTDPTEAIGFRRIASIRFGGRGPAAAMLYPKGSVSEI